MTIVNALKALYEALGGEHDDIVNVMTVTEALDKIQQLYDGEEISSDAAEAIQNIAAVAGNIGPEATLVSKTITENGEYDPADDEADGYSSVSVEVSGGGEPTILEFKLRSCDPESSAPSIPIKVFWNKEDEVDLSDIPVPSASSFPYRGNINLKIVHPIKKLTVPAVTNIGDTVDICFIPAAGFKIFEGDTELNISDIFDPKTYPGGYTQPFDPASGDPCALYFTNHPYDGVIKTLTQDDSGYDTSLNPEECILV